MTYDARAATIRRLRERYENAGYEIVEGPEPEEFPPDMGYGPLYTPAMLARRGDERLVFEIRESAAQVTDGVLERAQRIEKHPGWHLRLATSDDVVPYDAPGIQPAPPSWSELECVVDEVTRFVPALPGWMQLLVAWTALEGVLRRIAVDEGLPVDLLPATSLFTRLYDFGLIPYESYEPLKAAHEVHRRVRHGFAAPDERVSTAVRAVMDWLPALLPTAVERAA